MPSNRKEKQDQLLPAKVKRSQSCSSSDINKPIKKTSHYGRNF